MEYSKCALTKQSDKLVAISGIAREFKVLGVPEDYLAGMWRHTVMAQMLWRTAKVPGVDFPKQVRNGQYCAPSWSWASVTAPIWVTGAFDNASSVARLVDAEVTHLTNDKYGKVSSAYIRVTGCLRALHFTTHSHRSDQADYLLNNVKLRSRDRTYDFFGKTCVHMDQIGEVLQIQNRPHLFLLYRSIIVKRPPRSRLEGLVLIPTGVIHGQFQRHGTFEMTSLVSNPGWVSGEGKSFGPRSWFRETRSDVSAFLEYEFFWRERLYNLNFVGHGGYLKSGFARVFHFGEHQLGLGLL